MIFDIDGLQIVIIDKDDRMVFHESEGRPFERESLRAWVQMVQPGKVAVDVGAYTGLFSIIAAKRGAEVIALEPLAANRWRLGCNAAANKARLTILDVAASDENGPAELHYNPKVPLTSGASLARDKLHHTAIPIRRVTIDALALTNVGAMKIDVERHEPHVVRGAMQTITRDRPALLMETLDDAARDELLQLLPSYDIAAILDGRNTLFTPQ